MAPNPHVVNAFRAMRELGIPEEKTKPVLKNLLRIYEKNWVLIEEENYRALADAIFDSEEAEAAEQKKLNDNEETEAAELKKKLEQAELMKVIEEEETQIPEEPERPLKRLRLRHQDGSSCTPDSNGVPLKKPKLEIDNLPYAIPKSQARAQTSTVDPISPQQQSIDKGKKPVLPDIANDSGSDSGLRLRSSKDKGKEPISPQTGPREMRSAADRSSHGVRFREPKPKQTILPLIKPKDEPVDTSSAKIPPSVVRPESLTNGASSTEADPNAEADRPLTSQPADNKAPSDVTNGHELQMVPHESTERLDIASSSSGEIKISLCCNSVTKSNLSLHDLLNKMEAKCRNSYKFLEPNFSVKELMKDMCECLLEAETDSIVDANGDTDGSIGKKGDCENGFEHTESHSNDIRPVVDVNDISKGQESVMISLVNQVNTECPPAFNYIRNNAVFQNAYVNFSLARIGDDNCCSSCFGDCLTSSTLCACALQSGGEFAYTQEGLVKEELLEECIKMNRDPQKHCLFYCKECPLERSKNDEIVEACKGHSVRSFIKECWLKCGCNKQCGNRVVQRGIKAKLQVFMTPGGKGWGLRTLEDLPKGAFVCEYVGEVLTNAELYERVSKSSNKDEHAYPVLLDADWGAESELKDEEALCLDATYYGNVARFVNHRCFDSNMVEIPVEVENPDHHYYHLAFFTTRKVKALEELTWDYGIDFDDDEHPVKAFRCKCGSRFCRNIKRPNRSRKRRSIK
ncbi:probable inactive histone-lysine N-methyltransferase SUVR2 [Rutidosis leptorrhynchoides]|uniref:probable inactive histone-lysine N-methyltransferase SUVR2 n=1 Tax=Rutidosis leptorrhynchoides TaxID=125765 RepID=UPI003A99320A